jgi:O-antigen/teichoic acid export membrane protein
VADSLRGRAIKGVFWTLVESFRARLTQFVVGIVLARLLLPEEFGLIGSQKKGVFIKWRC